MIDLQRYRREKKLDQKDISRLTGLDQSIISKYENGRHVTQHVTDVLLSKIPALESYMIQENVVAEPQGEYKSKGYLDKLIENNHELIKNIEKLIDNNCRLVEVNEQLSKKILEKV